MLCACLTRSSAEEAEGEGAGVAAGDGGRRRGVAGGGGSGLGSGGYSPVTFEVSFVPHAGWTPAICEECMAAARDRAEVAKSVFKVTTTRWGSGVVIGQYGGQGKCYFNMNTHTLLALLTERQSFVFVSCAIFFRFFKSVYFYFFSFCCLPFTVSSFVF